MTSDSIEIIRREYQLGKNAFEGGQYRQSMVHLEKAAALVERNSRLGGEVQIWLVTAYEALGMRGEAIALCQQLEHHPSWETRQQGSRLRYILEAPQLHRRPEWLTKIPDLASMSESDLKYRRGAGVSKLKKSSPENVEVDMDVTQVNTQDNRFIWVALIISSLAIGGLLWLS